MFDRPRESLRELIRSQQEESKGYQEKRDEEFRQYLEKRDKEFGQYLERRDKEFGRYLERRDGEFEQYLEKRDEEVEAHKAELHCLREKSKAREEETRQFNREILLRNEKVYKAVIAEMEEGRKQLRANTKAVLSVLDRLEGSGGLAA